MCCALCALCCPPKKQNVLNEYFVINLTIHREFYLENLYQVGDNEMKQFPLPYLWLREGGCPLLPITFVEFKMFETENLKIFCLIMKITGRVQDLI